jgi:uncharacterized glyoxalase superfamily protein PhnB
MSANSSKQTISHNPKGFTSITPYFRVNDGDKFLEFVKNAFEAEIIDDHRRENGELWHAAIKIYGSMIEASQVSPEYPPNETAIHLYVPDCDAVYQRAIEHGGKSIFEVTDMPYGERSGGIIDPCGNHWYIATQITDMYPDNQ